ncbi:MAG: Carbamoyl-phosphate synthase small chain [Bacteroidetes bacterium ADurb.BinA104]|nr:MAG: Carbamoyl-phosphate synthase small chain [Bacteroidetes bacterium ADurb.BinA104]
MRVSLILADGTCFKGESFGYEQPVSGELVFNTAMTGYPELLTEPASRGQLLVMTYPVIGNYGIQHMDADENGLPTNAESEHAQAYALIVSDYSDFYSHWNAKESLGEWMKREKVTGVKGVDTRELTKHIRDHGTMTAKIMFDGMPKPAEYLYTNMIPEVSCKEPITYNEGAPKRVVLVDCGVKAGVIRCLINEDLTVVRVPWDYDYCNMEFDGLVISDGPGNPSYCSDVVTRLQKFMANSDKPILGIGMGCLLLGLAGGMDTYRLKFGHHSHNQPVILAGTDRCFITMQNHNYAIREASILGHWKVYLKNLNDNSVEGIYHTRHPWVGVMFHSESDRVDTDARFIYDDFIVKL